VLAAIGDITFGQLVLAIIVGVVISLAVFAHASKHGNKHPTAWGVLVFLFPAAVVAYLVYYYLTRRPRR
jgi:predicted PurR-regulated permease PerM